jgi:cysteine-rich repeat protein
VVRGEAGVDGAGLRIGKMIVGYHWVNCSEYGTVASGRILSSYVSLETMGLMSRRNNHGLRASVEYPQSPVWLTRMRAGQISCRRSRLLVAFTEMALPWMLIINCAVIVLSACSADSITPAPGGEDCEIAGDEDGNGLSDCGDPVCATTPTCQPACGNGLVTAGEVCDDGNVADGDGCDSNCTATACGNGLVTAGEVCDDGNAADGDGCDSNCTATACGNGLVTAGEVCDDGNAADGDGCDSNCTATACGNGLVTAGEVCDDGNALNWDGCNRTCGGSVPVYAKASNSSSSIGFGSSIALSADGSTLAVGACGERSAATGVGGNQTNTSVPQAGAVYIFTRVGTTWSQQAYVKASNTGAIDIFCTVALSADGSTLAVGAIGEDSAATGIDGNQADNSKEGAGAVYVYTRSGTTWSQQAYAKASNTAAQAYFGWSLALSGDGSALAVAAYNEGGDTGAVYVFTRNGTTWSEQAYLKASRIGAEKHFGESIALSADGSTLAVGAGFDLFVPQAGAVYVFMRTGVTWSEQAYLKSSNIESGDTFGRSVALSSDGATLAVGAIHEDSAATGVGGNQSDNSAVNSGAAYVFTRNGTAWHQQAYVKASNTGSAVYFGWSIALSADASTLVVGAVNERSAATGLGGNQADNSKISAGAVYVFTRSATTWSQRAYVKASNTDDYDSFGGAVALSADGSILVVGASGEDGGSVGIGGNPATNFREDSGAVYVYQ